MKIAAAIYEQKTYRLLTMFRGSLIALINDKTLSAVNTGLGEADAITLMSADIDRIESMTIVHELYTGLIELGVALWLLYNLLGLALVAPVVWIVGKSSIPLGLFCRSIAAGTLVPNKEADI